MTKYLKYVPKAIYFFVIAVLLVQCQKDEIAEDIITTEILDSREEVSFLIVVIDESKKLIQDATIKVNGLSGIFEGDENGIFQLARLELEELGTKITVEKEGYHTQEVSLMK